MLVQNARIFLGYKIQSMCYVAFTIPRQKILKCWYVYYVHRLKHAALQIMRGVQKFQNSKYLSIHWYDAQ